MYKFSGFAVLSVVFCLVACVEPQVETQNRFDDVELADVEQAVRPPTCEDNGVEMDELLDFVSNASYDSLNDDPYFEEDGTYVRNCHMPSDLAWNLSHHGRFQCLDEIGDVDGMGDGAWRGLLSCTHDNGYAIGLKYVFDQHATPHDITVAFSTVESDQTELFINQATRSELMAVDGIGATLADRLIANRPLNLFWLWRLDGFGVIRIRALKAAAADWAAPPAPPQETTVWTASLNDLPAELVALIELEMELINPGCEVEPVPGCIFPAEFDEAYITYVDGQVVEYEVHVSQWQDPEGGIKIWFTYWYDANFVLVNEDIMI